LDALVTQMNEQKGFDIGIHVDAASGGFIAPFCYPNLRWDFRLKNVRSINVSGHKYGLAPCGIGWLIFRSAEYLPEELVFHVNYLGADQASFTLNFSRGSAQIVASYYLLLRLGRRGYQNLMHTLKELASYFATRITEDGRFRLLSDNESLPLVAFAIPDDQRTKLGFDEFAIAGELRKRGWIVPAYTLAPNLQHQKLLRVVVRVGFTRDRADMLVQDIRAAYDHLVAMAGLLNLFGQGLAVDDTASTKKPESEHTATALGKMLHANKSLQEHAEELRRTHDLPGARHLIHMQNWGTIHEKEGTKDAEPRRSPVDRHQRHKKRSGAVC
jgi:glutamate/tyrosine decarboxylase-like PLP-dependent enzyme